MTKFSQISVFSGFNQPYDVSMDIRYESICGITEKELHQYFAKPIEEMAEELDYSVDEMKEVLKKQYDGYHFSKKMVDIYNPFSIINAFQKMEVDDYWYRSGTPTYLAKLLEGHHVNMQKLTGQPCSRSRTSNMPFHIWRISESFIELESISPVRVGRWMSGLWNKECKGVSS